MHVRRELPGDVPGVRAVNLAAFETAAEATLVDALRAQAAPIVSLVALEPDGHVAGHILFSPATVANHPSLRVMGLAPMAVLPHRQRQGIGSMLVRAGIEECRQLGIHALIVLGHATYYPRFGFMPASHFQLTSEYDAPDDVFMALELDPGALRAASGTVRYHAAFANL
jgi:putative acetyltransferase